MDKAGYEQGRLDLPFVAIATFGIDLVEVAPDYDHTGTTAILAAQILMNTIGRIMHARSIVSE